MKKSKEMKYHIGIVLRLYPSYQQKHLIAVNCGVQRAVYNKLVAYDRERYALGRISVYLKPVADRLEYLRSFRSDADSIKHLLPFVNSAEVDSCVVGNGVRNYFRAWSNFRNIPGTSIPTFHKKSACESYQTDNHYRKGATDPNSGSICFCDHGRRVKLPKLGMVRSSGSEKMIRRVLEHRGETRFSTATISKDATGRYYVSISIASEEPFFPQFEKTGSEVGIDMNLNNFLTDSDGNVVENPRFRKNILEKLASARRRLSGMARRAEKEGRSLCNSKNYQKQRRRAAELQRHAAAQMEDFEHIISLHLIKNHDSVFAEDLRVRNLLANSRLARSISDVSWSRFFDMLSYKATAYGRRFLQIPAHGTTQTCHVCGHVCKGADHIKLGIEQWSCPVCGTPHLRDANAAVNIRARGLAFLSL